MHLDNVVKMLIEGKTGMVCDCDEVIHKKMNMHQNKPTASIIYIDKRGKKIEVDKSLTETYPLDFTKAELAIMQTLVNRAYFNCNCNLDKEVVQGVVVKVRGVLNG